MFLKDSYYTDMVTMLQNTAKQQDIKWYQMALIFKELSIFILVKKYKDIKSDPLHGQILYV